jgi:hypothetical protein
VAVNLKNNEFIITAWAEVATGPGWSNAPIYVLIGARGGGGHRVECLQPGEQGPLLPLIHRAAAAMSEVVTDRVRAIVGGYDT